MTLADNLNRIIWFRHVIYGVNIPIHQTKVSNTRSKKISTRTPTKSPQKSNLQPNDTKITDRLKIENVYEVDGWIEPIESSDTDILYFPDVKSAYQVKKDLLKYVFNENSKSEVMYMNYEGEMLYGTMEKVDITEEAMDKNTDDCPRYEVKFIFVSKVNTIA